MDKQRLLELAGVEGKQLNENVKLSKQFRALEKAINNCIAGYESVQGMEEDEAREACLDFCQDYIENVY